MHFHVLCNDTFSTPYIDFIKEYFDVSEHKFYYVSKKNNEKADFIIHRKLSKFKIFSFLQTTFFALEIIFFAFKSKQVIFHGLFDEKVIVSYSFFPKLLRKAYWCVYGGDLYVHNSIGHSLRSRWVEKRRALFISQLAGLITHVKGDFRLAQKYYNAPSNWKECFLYPSNLAPVGAESEESFRKAILIGNSAATTNCHLEVFNKISSMVSSIDIEVVVPLSYGSNDTYVRQVIENGRSMFSSFKPITDFMEKESYLKLLNETYIAFFNHKRQQALGNITTLLFLGKKVYLRSDIASWELFEQLGIKVFDILGDIDLEPLSDADAKVNREKILNYFSIDNLISQWAAIFDECSD